MRSIKKVKGIYQMTTNVISEGRIMTISLDDNERNKYSAS